MPMLHLHRMNWRERTTVVAAAVASISAAIAFTEGSLRVCLIFFGIQLLAVAIALLMQRQRLGAEKIRAHWVAHWRKDRPRLAAWLTGSAVAYAVAWAEELMRVDKDPGSWVLPVLVGGAVALAVYRDEARTRRRR